MFPTERSNLSGQLWPGIKAALCQIPQRYFQIAGVPKDNGGYKQVQARGPVVLFSKLRSRISPRRLKKIALARALRPHLY